MIAKSIHIVLKMYYLTNLIIFVILESKLKYALLDKHNLFL